MALLGLLGVVLLAGVALIHLGGLRLEPVLTGSMRPGAPPGSLAVLKPEAAADLRVGDVIAYLPPGRATPVMHRIVSITSEGIVTKGDANPVADPWGRVRPGGTTVQHLIAVVPDVGWLAGARTQLMMAVGSGLLLLLLAIVWIDKEAPQDSPD